MRLLLTTSFIVIFCLLKYADYKLLFEGINLIYLTSCDILAYAINVKHFDEKHYHQIKAAAAH